MIEKVKQIAKNAGKQIMEIYNSNDFNTEYKNDNSPITKADTASHELIKSTLLDLADFPIMSEEEIVSYNIRKDWKTFWLVDPLDGTKDFIAKNGEFTVNIALVEDGKPILGVVYLPFFDDIYYAQKGKGAYKNDKKIFNTSNRTDLIAADSNFYSTKQMQDFFKTHNIKDIRKYGSSIKICKLSEGDIDVYPRLNETKEWDTAAVHVIANESGCKLIDVITKKELIYNKQSYRNNHFIVSRKDLDFL